MAGKENNKDKRKYCQLHKLFYSSRNSFKHNWS